MPVSWERVDSKKSGEVEEGIISSTSPPRRSRLHIGLCGFTAATARATFLLLTLYLISIIVIIIRTRLTLVFFTRGPVLFKRLRSASWYLTFVFFSARLLGHSMTGLSTVVPFDFFCRSTTSLKGMMYWGRPGLNAPGCSLLVQCQG